MTSPVATEWFDGVLVARIDRQDRRNAADLETYDLLEAAVDSDAVAVVLTGAGGHFSAGDDVRMFQFDGIDGADAFVVHVTRLFQRIEAVPRPVVAAVDGYALGFGFELALACDAIVATPDAVLGLPEITHGAGPPNAIGRGPSTLGRNLIRHLAIDGQHWLTGTEAHRYGMVVELHPGAVLEAAAVRLASELAANQRFLGTKRLLSLESETAYRLAPVIMPPLMASSEVAASSRRFRANG